MTCCADGKCAHCVHEKEGMDGVLSKEKIEMTAKKVKNSKSYVELPELKKDVPLEEKNECNGDNWREKAEKLGLAMVIKPGEMLPWKRIWFEVESVFKDRIVLKPMTTTASLKKAKERA